MSPSNTIKAIDRNLRSERGAILFIVAAGMMVFIGLAGLALDLGMLYNVKTDLQNATDAAALAGASQLDGTAQGITDAVNEAITAANKFNFNTTSVGLTAAQITFSATRDPEAAYVSQATAAATPGAIRFVRAATTKTMSLALVKIIPGVGGTRDVAASAVAGKSPPITTACDGLAPLSPAPIIDPGNPTGPPLPYVVGQIYDLRLAGGNDNLEIGSGNYLILDFSPVIGGNSGGAAVRDLLAGGSQGCVTLGAPICSKPGVTSGPVRQGLNDRFDTDGNTTEYPLGSPAGPAKATYENNGGTGERILPVPLVSSTFPAYSPIQNGRDCPIYIYGFGCFLIRTRIPNGNTTVTGEFVGDCTTGGKSNPNVPVPPTNLPSLTRIILYR
jgi:Flp pilus assembly protein TadG